MYAATYLIKDGKMLRDCLDKENYTPDTSILLVKYAVVNDAGSSYPGRFNKDELAFTAQRLRKIVEVTGSKNIRDFVEDTKKFVKEVEGKTLSEIKKAVYTRLKAYTPELIL